MGKDKEKEGEKLKKKSKTLALSGLFSSSNSGPKSPPGDAALTYLRAKYPLISPGNLQNPHFRTLLQMSEDTIVLDRDNRYKMLGAQNLNGITCFLNATLFAMFCRSDSCFDKLLYSALDGPVGRFATMVRLWVNMLRSGWFISSDIVAQLRENLAQSGWEIARMDQQQDASECYIHMVEALRLPKTTLQTQFEHGARRDIESDHKFETEYLLDCSIPNKPPGDAIWLEECLTDYFTNIVEVRRKLSATPGDITPAINHATKPDASSSYISSSSSADEPPPYSDDGRGFYESDEKTRLKASLQVPGSQERNVAAWQFFKLLPYYAPTSGQSETTINLANEKPMLGICLKRYGYDVVRKAPYRNGRRVVIPKYIELSNFVSQEASSEKQYRLVFYSTVCHRGQYVQSGHYVSIVWDRQNDMWLHFDDIAAQKITSSTPEYLLSNETPYLLFYQLEEVGEVPKTPGIYVPPTISMPQIPPPPSRPPPPIPQTSFVAKETNQQPPSPRFDTHHSEAYQYTEPPDSPNLPSYSFSPPSATTLAPPTGPPPPPPPLYIPIPSPNRHPPAPPPPPNSLQQPQIHSQMPSHPPPPPPEQTDFLDMPASPPIPHQSHLIGSNVPPMPSYPPPLPPVGPQYLDSSSGYPLDMPEPPAYSPQGGKLFDMDDEEDLYGETRWNGKNAGR